MRKGRGSEAGRGKFSSCCEVERTQCDHVLRLHSFMSFMSFMIHSFTVQIKPAVYSPGPCRRL
jgi:hypothetical protein